MIKKIKKFFQTTKKKFLDFIHRPSRKELLRNIDGLKSTLRMYEESRNFVETRYLNRYSFNVAFPKYTYNYRDTNEFSNNIEHYIAGALAEKVAEFIRENKCYQTYEGHKTNGHFMPEDEVKVYHCELWFEKKTEPTVNDYFKRQHQGDNGFNLRCEKSF